jgi:hypothetical protein
VTPAVRQIGWFDIRLLGPDGRPAWRSPRRLLNAVTYQGLNKCQDVMFKGVTPITAWYLLPISAASFTALSANDTHASHAGWVEYTGYSGNRPAWVPGTATNGVLAASTPSTLTFTASGSLKGLALASVNTNGSTSSGGTLWATAEAGLAVAVASGQTLEIFYTNAFTIGS